MRGSRARRGWSVTTDLRVEALYVEDDWLHVLVGLNENAVGDGGLPHGGLLNTDGWQKARRGRWCAPPALLRNLPFESLARFCGASPSRLMLRDSTAASLGPLDGFLFNAEERRSGDLEGARGERMGASCSADFITVSP